MTEPQLDPITGLPADISTSSIFSIPLNSRPALAPQWQPQGSEPPGIYPDRIPSVFATMQAQNQDNPGTVNALRTHTGTQALEVYDLAASGGGASSPIKYAANTGGTASFGNGAHLLGTFGIPTAVYQVSVAYAWDGSGAFPVTGPILLRLCNSTGGSAVTIGQDNQYVASATTGNNLAGTILVTFNPPFSPSLSGIDDGSGSIGISINNTTGVSFSFTWSCLHS